MLQRATTVKIKAQDETGAKVSLSLTDWQARIFQHEYDHLQARRVSFPCALFGFCFQLHIALIAVVA